MADSLPDRLRAAIDETEYRAKLALEISATWAKLDNPPSWEVAMQQAVACCDTVKLDRAMQHLHQNADPERELRRCAADRKILDAYEHADRVAGSGISPEGNYANGLEFAVREIAEAYGVEA